MHRDSHLIFENYLKEQIDLAKPKVNLSANHSETQPGNIPVGAEVARNYRDEQQESEPAAAEAKSRERAGVIVKIDRKDLDNSQVQVSGYGVVTLGQLKKNLSGKFEDLSKRITNNEPVFVWKRVREKYGFLMHGVRALIEAERDIERMRRAGKMPGMLKRYNFSS
jgi:hypothetical protein